MVFEIILILFLPIFLFYFIFIRILKININRTNRLIWWTVTVIWIALFYYFAIQMRNGLQYHPIFVGIGIFIVTGLIYQNLTILKDVLKEHSK